MDQNTLRYVNLCLSGQINGSGVAELILQREMESLRIKGEIAEIPQYALRDICIEISMAYDHLHAEQTKRIRALAKKEVESYMNKVKEEYEKGYEAGREDSKLRPGDGMMGG